MSHKRKYAKVRGNHPPGRTEDEWVADYSEAASVIYTWRKAQNGEYIDKALRNEDLKAAHEDGSCRDRAIEKLIGLGKLPQTFLDLNP